MRRLATLTAILAVALPPATSLADGRHVLWAVKGQRNTVYLLGAVHLLRPEEAGLPEVAERAYEDAEQLVMEIDMDDPAVADPAVLGGEMQRMALLPEGKTLRSVLGADYERIRERAGEAGLELEMLERFAPWFVATTLLQLELAKRGFSPEFGIEQTLAERAGKDRKPIQGLESTAQQIGLLAGLPLPAQKRFLVATVEESQRLDRELDELLRAWRAGDTAALARLLSDEFDEDPDLYRALTVDRNRAWVGRLADLLDDRDDYLVVVGALHLVGRDSVVDLLRKRGYQVVQE
jgi:hypothetical protein